MGGNRDAFGFRDTTKVSLPRLTKDSACATTLLPQPSDVWRCDVLSTAIFHDFNKACRHEERCSKEPPIVISGKIFDSRSGGGLGRIGTTDKRPAEAAMEVTDTRNKNDDIVLTIYDIQHAERGGVRAWGQDQDIYRVRKFVLLPTSLSFLASVVLFHAQKKLRSNEKRFRKERGSRCRRLRRIEQLRKLPRCSH